MKYIRTKDGRIIESLTEIVEAYDKVPVYIYMVMNDGYKHCCNIQRDFVEKTSNTIEELCDEYVVKYKYKDKPETIRCLNNELKYIRRYILSIIKDIEFVKLAIWTDKGLIYVAKMKGVLPNGEIDWELL